jgi:hypothetical protein
VARPIDRLVNLDKELEARFVEIEREVRTADFEFEFGVRFTPTTLRTLRNAITANDTKHLRNFATWVMEEAEEALFFFANQNQKTRTDDQDNPATS